MIKIKTPMTRIPKMIKKKRELSLLFSCGSTLTWLLLVCIVNSAIKESNQAAYVHLEK